MPITLLESRQDRDTLNAGQTALSTTIHIALMTFALFASSRLARKFETAAPEQLNFAQLSFVQPFAKLPAIGKRKPSSDATAAEQPAPSVDPLQASFDVLMVALEIPDVIPDIDVLAAVTDESRFTGRGVAHSVAYGTYASREAGAGMPAAGQPYEHTQVEKVAAQAGGCTPRFPDRLSDAGVEGSVLVQFVVDTNGRAEPRSFKTLSSGHELFDRAVRTALRCMRFYPAEVAGQKVRQLVQQPFAFVLSHH